MTITVLDRRDGTTDTLPATLGGLHDAADQERDEPAAVPSQRLGAVVRRVSCRRRVRQGAVPGLPRPGPLPLRSTGAA